MPWRAPSAAHIIHGGRYITKIHELSLLGRPFKVFSGSVPSNNPPIWLLQPNAFDNIRGQMGIKNLEDLEILKNLPKKEIKYHLIDKEK